MKTLKKNPWLVIKKSVTKYSVVQRLKFMQNALDRVKIINYLLK